MKYLATLLMSVFMLSGCLFSVKEFTFEEQEIDKIFNSAKEDHKEWQDSEENSGVKEIQ